MTTDLIPLRQPDPAALFAPGGLEDLLARIEAEARALVPDLTTKKGQEAIASNAARVARSKTYLDDLGKGFVADLKKKSAIVDRERRAMRERLDALKAEVRRPLTEHEQAEADRQAAVHARIAALAAPLDDWPGLSSATVAARLAEVEAVAIDAGFAEFATEAQQTKDAALFRLHTLLSTVRQREASAAQAAAERQAKAEAERAEREARIAAEATAAAEQRARAVIETAERNRQEAIRAQADAERRAAAAEARARAQIEPGDGEQYADTLDQAAPTTDAALVHREILADLCAIGGLSEGQGKRVVTAIAKGQVPHLSITY
jgi:hypothetical protein